MNVGVHVYKISLDLATSGQIFPWVLGAALRLIGNPVRDSVISHLNSVK
jgi:hypothetical protein